MSRRLALVVGVTGIGGRNIAEQLLADDWEVAGLSRTPGVEVPGIRHIHADVLDLASLEDALSGTEPTHLFFATWKRCATEAENCRDEAACCVICGW